MLLQKSKIQKDILRLTVSWKFAPLYFLALALSLCPSSPSRSALWSFFFDVLAQDVKLLLIRTFGDLIQWERKNDGREERLTAAYCSKIVKKVKLEKWCHYVLVFCGFKSGFWTVGGLVISYTSSWSGLTMHLCRNSVGTYWRAHQQLVREHSASVISAHWANVDWFLHKELN